MVLLYWGYHNLTTATIKIHSKYITTEKYSFFSLRKNHYNKQEIIVVLKIFTNFNLKVFEIILKGIWRKRPCFEKIFGWVLNHTRWSLEHTEVQSFLKQHSFSGLPNGKTGANIIPWISTQAVLPFLVVADQFGCFRTAHKLEEIQK